MVPPAIRSLFRSPGLNDVQRDLGARVDIAVHAWPGIPSKDAEMSELPRQRSALYG
jgi:hypothetical protein